MSTEIKDFIGLTGFARSGKSEIASFLQDEYGYRVIRPSDIVRQALEARFGERPFARSEYRTMSEELRNESGPGYYLDGIDYHNQRTLVDGARHVDTVRFIQRQGGFVIGIVAQTQERFHRALRANDSKKKPASLEEFEMEERPEMNAAPHEHGGQILKALCCVHPSEIIDTTSMKIDEVYDHVAATLARRGIARLPVEQRYSNTHSQSIS